MPQQNGESAALGTKSILVPGIASATVYLSFALFYSSAEISRRGAARQIFIWVALALLVVFYRQGYLALRRTGSSALKHVISFAAIFGLVALFIPPFNSDDLYGYVNRGWQQAHYGLDPYVHSLSSIPGWRYDPMFTDHWAYNPSPYGFLFTLMARLVCQAGAGDLGRTLILFKVVDLLVLAAIGWVLFAAAKRLELERTDLPLYLYLWNPFVLLQQVANGHNDLLVALFVMIAIYFALADRALWMMPALTAAFLIKYVAAVVMPFALVFVLRRRGAIAAIISSGVAVLLLLAIGAPYLSDWSRFQAGAIAVNATITIDSLEAALFYSFEALTKLAPALHGSLPIVNTLLKASLWCGAGLLLVIQLVRFVSYRPPSVEQLIAAALFAEFLVICVASSKFQAWYIGMLFPVAMLLRVGHWLRRLVVLISLTGLLAFTFLEAAHIVNYLSMIGIPMVWVAVQQWPQVSNDLTGWRAAQPAQASASLAERSVSEQ